MSEWVRKIGTAEARVVLAFIVLIGFFVTVILFAAWYPDFFDQYLTAALGLASAVIGFYFGSRRTQSTM